MGFGKLDAPLRAAAARVAITRIERPKIDHALLEKLERVEDYEGCARHLELASIGLELRLVSAALTDSKRLSVISIDL